MLLPMVASAKTVKTAEVTQDVYDQFQNGVNIIRYHDGTTKKVIVK